MAFVSGHRARVYVGEFNLSSFLNNVSAASVADTVDCSTFGDGNRDYFKTLQAATVTMSGFIDGAAGGSEPVLADLLAATAGKAVSIFWDADAIASPGICGAALEASYEDTSPIDGVQAIAANLTFTGAAPRAVSLHALGTETATGTYTSVDNVTSSPNGAIANLHVTAAGATGTGTILVQDSADNSSFVTIGTFSNFTAATSQSLEITAPTATPPGTIRRYVRANLSSARNTQTFAVAFGRRP